MPKDELWEYFATPTVEDWFSMQDNLKFKFIAVDFDETISTYGQLNIENPVRPHAVRVLKRVKAYGGKIAIWTCRSGIEELTVRGYLTYHNVPFDKLNENFDENIAKFGGDSKKVFADVFIDDRCIYLKGQEKQIDWLEIEKLLFKEIENV